MNEMIYVLPDEDPLPFRYTRQQIADGVGVLVVVAAALVGVATLILGAWGW